MSKKRQQNQKKGNKKSKRQPPVKTYHFDAVFKGYENWDEEDSFPLFCNGMVNYVRNYKHHFHEEAYTDILLNIGTLLGFYNSGQQTFELPTKVYDSLLKVDPPIIEADSILFPYETFYVKIPEERRFKIPIPEQYRSNGPGYAKEYGTVFGIYFLEYKGGEQAAVGTVMVRFALDPEYWGDCKGMSINPTSIAHSLMRRATIHCFILPLAPVTKIGEDEVFTNLIENTISFNFDSGEDLLIQQDPDYASKAKLLVRLAINALVLINSGFPRENIQKRDSVGVSDGLKKLEQTSSEKEKTAHKKTITRLSRAKVTRLSSIAVSSDSGKPRQSHIDVWWRMAHYRRIWVGPRGNQTQKKVLIKAGLVYRGGKKTDVDLTKPRVYR